MRLSWNSIGALLVPLVLLLRGSFGYAQSVQETAYSTLYEVHGGMGIPDGLHLGGRVQPWQGLGFEASVGMLLLSPSLTAGIDIPAPAIFEGTRPSWSILGNYFTSSDARWYGVSVTYGLLDVGLRGLHVFGRIGASLMVKQNASSLVYPLPCFDIGLGWTFGDH